MSPGVDDVVIRDVHLERRDAGDRARRARGSRPGSWAASRGRCRTRRDSSVKRSPTSCMPSPESPANRITTRSSVSARRVGLASTVTVDLCFLMFGCAVLRRCTVARPPASRSARRRAQSPIGAAWRHCTATPAISGLHAALGVTSARAPRARPSPRRSSGLRHVADRAPARRRRPRARPATRFAPPARKNRRRTRPTTTISSPGSSSSTQARRIPADDRHRQRLPSSRRVVTCSCTSALPDGSTRTSGGLEHDAAHDGEVHATSASSLDRRRAARSTYRLGCDTLLRSEGRSGTRASDAAATIRARLIRRLGMRSAEGDEALGDVGERRVVAARRGRTARGPAGGRRRVRRDRRARTRGAGGGLAGRCTSPPRRSSIAIASSQPAASASEPASTMRPSVTSAADGDAAASSSHSSSTLRVTALRPRAVHQHRVLLDRAGEVGERARAPWSRPGTGPRR